MPDIPAWIKAAREKWRYRGQVLPPFAENVEQGQESVWDYPRPPRIEADQREVSVGLGETTLAQTTNALRVLETASPPTYYIPPSDVRVDLMEPAPSQSLCEWKGKAKYWSIVLPDRRLRSAAWSYDEPFPGFEQIAGYFSFYPAIVECYVGGARVKPQPGGVYGGWITPQVRGPFKGAPGTEHW